MSGVTTHFHRLQRVVMIVKIHLLSEGYPPTEWLSISVVRYPPNTLHVGAAIFYHICKYVRTIV